MKWRTVTVDTENEIQSLPNERFDNGYQGFDVPGRVDHKQTFKVFS